MDNLTNEYIQQVRTFGALDYTPERICRLLGLSKHQSQALQYRMATPGDVYHDAYLQGRALGDYNVDAELAKGAENGDKDAIELLAARKLERQELDIRQKLFGI